MDQIKDTAEISYSIFQGEQNNLSDIIKDIRILIDTYGDASITDVNEAKCTLVFNICYDKVVNVEQEIKDLELDKTFEKKS